MNTMHKNNRQSTINQTGFVSIVVSMIIMTILSLITIGFAQLMAREQRQALDRQLSTQAFYAAESGVNDVDRAVKTNTVGGTYGATCTLPSSISADGSVRNTCITYSSTVPDIRFQAIPPNPFDPRVFPLRAVSGTTQTVTINFTPTNIIGSIPRFRPNGTTALPPTGTSAGQWNASTGLMKVYLVPFRNGMNRQQLIDATAYYTFYPRDVAGITSTPYTSGTGANYGSIIPVNCNNTTGCNVRITGIDSLAYNDMYMVVNAVYQPNDIVVDARSATGSQEFRDVQAIVDSTGRTTDVLRRVQVRLPIGEEITSAAGALIATDPAGTICKLYETSPAATTAISPCRL
jgi:type II secretory pathway pseudopilin PulG